MVFFKVGKRIKLCLTKKNAFEDKRFNWKSFFQDIFLSVLAEEHYRLEHKKLCQQKRYKSRKLVKQD